MGPLTEYPDMQTVESLKHLPLEELTDEVLMLRLKGGEKRALALLIERWQRSLYRHIYRMVLDAALAEDLFQETFLRIYASIHRYKPTAKFSTYAFKIATNLSINEIKKRQRRRPVALQEELGGDDDRTYGHVVQDERDTPDSFAERVQDIGMIREALNELPEHQRAVLVLSFYEGLPYEEIAEILDCSVGTVKSRVHRAKKAIAGYLKETGRLS